MPTTLQAELTTLLRHLQPYQMIVAGALAVLGVVLLLWGRSIHRAALVLLAFPLGMGVGSILAQRIQLSPLVGALTGAITLTILVIVLARVIWAVLAGLWLAGIAATIAGLFYVGGAFMGAQPAGWRPGVDVLAYSAWDAGGMAIVAAASGAGVGGLILGLLMPRATVIAVTSLLAVAMLSDAVTIALTAWAPKFLAGVQNKPLLAAGLCLSVLLLGVLHQSIQEIRHRRRQAEAADTADGKKKLPKSARPDA